MSVDNLLITTVPGHVQCLEHEFDEFKFDFEQAALHFHENGRDVFTTTCSCYTIYDESKK